MKRTKDISELKQKDENSWIARIEMEDTLTPFDVIELYQSMDNTCFNLEQQIKGGRAQVIQINLQIKQIEMKLKHFQRKRAEVKKQMKIAEPLLSNEEKKKYAEMQDKERKSRSTLEKRQQEAK